MSSRTRKGTEFRKSVDVQSIAMVTELTEMLKALLEDRDERRALSS